MNVIGKKIKELRTTKEINQKEFASKIGVTQASLSSYENGIKQPSLDVLSRIASEFNVSLDWLCDNKVSRHFVTGTDIIDLLVELKQLQGFNYEIASEDHKVSISFDYSQNNDSADFTQNDLAEFFKEYADLIARLDKIDDDGIKKDHLSMWLEKKRTEYSSFQVKCINE